jgi:lathosterol oxidase
VIGALILTTAALSAIIALRYIAIAGAAYWLFWGGKGRRRRSRQLNRQPPRLETVRHEVLASMIATPIYALPAAAALEGWKHGYTKIYLDPTAYGWWWLPASAAIYLLAHDAFYYWLHRGLHHPRVFRWAGADPLHSHSAGGGAGAFDGDDVHGGDEPCRPRNLAFSMAKPAHWAAADHRHPSR